MAVTLNALTTGVGGLQTTGDTSGAIQLQSNGTATLTVDSSGNVGIGTASPGAKLDISSAVVGDVNVRAYNTSNNASARSVLLLGNDTSSTAFGIYLQSSTNSGLSGTNSVNLYQGTANPMSFWTNGSERMRIDSVGAIGLGGANYGTSGQFLTSGGSGAAASWTTAAAGGFSNMTVFTSPGTFTTPATTTKIKVTVVGGGGSGGCGNGFGSAGGGGAAIYVGPVTASTPYAVTVGAGGTGAAFPSSGVTGGTSSFGALASATGGVGGIAHPGTTQTGSLGGAGSAGTLQFAGSSGSSVAGVSTGGGGPSFLGAGSQCTPAAAGRNYGGGGSGSGSPGPSGAGAGGVVIVEY